MKHTYVFYTCSILILTFLLGASPVLSQETGELVLADRGPYDVGTMTFTLIDESRDDLELVTTVWYPAALAEDESGISAVEDASVDVTGAPYPVIVNSHGRDVGRIGFSGIAQLTVHLASHGYIVISSDHYDDPVWRSVISRPLDVLFVLDQVESMTEGNLAEIIDHDRIGVMGWSLGGLTAIQMIGARVDSSAWPVWCDGKSLPLICISVTDQWDMIVETRSNYDPPLEDEALWPALGEDRFKAAFVMAPIGAPIFGESGLDSVETPVMIMTGMFDNFAVYDRDVVFLYNEITALDKYLLTLQDADHMFPVTDRYKALMLHFATAFFGYYIQDHEEYAEYLTKDFAEQFQYVLMDVADD